MTRVQSTEPLKIGFLGWVKTLNIIDATTEDGLEIRNVILNAIFFIF